MTTLIVIILIVGLAGITGNQYAALRRMESIQHSIDDMNRRLEELNRKRID
ncbi:hypothetical protein WJ0W_003860 [Paenibacillus melissococcoides]|uniref:Uncharacterized protein n=1 Tax=Paenibacillus melissococcoides TaxID=2912268 RepID=A0ABN8U6A2_9BACL|nr:MULTISPECIES: hypothetical protein [Paenibacillus]MEB9894515.1 hypothetical protein [Bacillus cereus]CAH8246626.1 hypothetical protein WJ0W_003860 [Paenibacillus melissococcoides]CAH8715300.1 hypothetical protein HTL2_004229 [Paenibacillus melissococcoides]CAH8716232.1 hypothetical protein WDD9_004496 [Paenibacillus melissococcoides]GIO80002.1 hypothetical protein J6TS7_36120 [Paenibacillus dendritiformis]